MRDRRGAGDEEGAGGVGGHGGRFGVRHSSEPRQRMQVWRATQGYLRCFIASSR